MAKDARYQYHGCFKRIGAVLPMMQAQQDGLIISTDSVAGHVVYRFCRL